MAGQLFTGTEEGVYAMEEKSYSMARDFWKNIRECFSQAFRNARSVVYRNDEE